MIALVIFGFLFTGLMTFTIVRLSISFVFWSYRRPVDKQHVFKVCFPYYIIILSAICIAFILNFDNHPVAIYYFSLVYLTALLIWKSEIKSSLKKNKNFADETNPTQLP
ncbi:MAG: hypothetical protein JJ870_01010 [Winogradskyella sp.]|nr:hypothetical protein [Winogradskyella sp.]